MLRISGPISLGAVQVSTEAKLLLFGDEHASRKGLCDKCKRLKNCHYITDFLDSILEPTELFVESLWLPPSNTKMPPKSYDVMGDVVSKYHTKMYHNKSKAKEDNEGLLRVHYGDLRSEPNLYELLKVVLHYSQKQDFGKSNIPYDQALLSKYFPSVKSFKQFVDILVSSDNLQTSMVRFFNGNKNIATEFITNKYKTAKVHKVKKQISKITNKAWKKALLKYYSNRCQELAQAYKQYKTSLALVVAGKSTNEDEDIIFMTVLDWLSLITDIYTLARMLSYMAKDEAKVFVTYTGSYHTTIYINFFVNYLPKSKLIHYQPPTMKNKQVNRCVSLPSSFVSLTKR
jgi:hypothetical protein